MSIDTLVAGAVPSLLSHATPDKCKADIENNRSLFKDTTQKTWNKYRKIVAGMPGLNLSYEAVVDALSVNRPDLLAVIVSTDGGVPWLQQQVMDARAKLGLNPPPARHYVMDT